MRKIYIVTIVLSCIYSTSCKKLVTVDEPTNTVTTTKIFSDSTNASTAVAGIYGTMANKGFKFMSGILTTYLGRSSDELVPYNKSGDIVYSNTLTATYSQHYGDIWLPAYQLIHDANEVIAGLQSSGDISNVARKQFVGEAKFLRALFYFYLVNVYGPVPLTVSPDYRVNASLPRSSIDSVYGLIVADLRDAQDALPRNYDITGGDRIRANYWAATALLARVYLYRQQWDLAEQQATTVINSTENFSLDADLDNVFLREDLGNMEAILQLKLNTRVGTMNATPEGFAIIPNNSPSNVPRYYVSQQLLNAFEPNDLRMVHWLKPDVYRGKTYYCPYKYKIGGPQRQSGADPTEYITVLRLAEQYLIRAEARANLNKLTESISDVNVVRERAQLTDLPYTLELGAVMVSIAKERQIELFAEWGHRWLDLRRTNMIDQVMTIETPLKGQGTSWDHNQQLYPIPLNEIHADPSLIQNPGYF